MVREEFDKIVLSVYVNKDGKLIRSVDKKKQKRHNNKSKNKIKTDVEFD